MIQYKTCMRDKALIVKIRRREEKKEKKKRKKKVMWD